MKHLVTSFREHVGERGCHFYDEDACTFLTWLEVFDFLRSLSEKERADSFADRLTETLANYNPDEQFLAVQQNGDTVSVELYCDAVGSTNKY